jgi:prophage regulatory protein
MNQIVSQTNQLIALPELVSHLGGISRTTLWRLRRKKSFPEPIELSPGRVAWLRSDIDTWIADRVQARAAEAQRIGLLPKETA